MEIPEQYKGTFEGCSTWDNQGEIFKKIIDIVKPKNILEIGFFRGSSAYMWLYLSKSNLLSIDPMMDIEFPLNPRKYDGAPENIDKLKQIFTNRFNFLQLDSRFAYQFIKDGKFDLAWIDGSHFASFVYSDLKLAHTLKIPYILLDDFTGDVEKVYYDYFQKIYKTIEIFNTNVSENNKRDKICFCKLND